MTIIDGSPLPNTSGSTHLGYDPTTIKEINPYLTVHQHSGVFHGILGQSGVLRFNQGPSALYLFEISVDGGLTYDSLPASGLTQDSIDHYGNRGGDMSGIHRVSLVIENPTGSEDITIMQTPIPLKILEFRSVVLGASSPDVEWRIRHGLDRNAVGTNAGGDTTTSTTTVQKKSDFTGSQDTDVLAESFIWLESLSTNGMVNELHVTILYDPKA